MYKIKIFISKSGLLTGRTLWVCISGKEIQIVKRERERSLQELLLVTARRVVYAKVLTFSFSFSDFFFFRFYFFFFFIYFP